MKKPSEVLERLYDIGIITALSVEYRQTGDDTSETYVEIVGKNGSCSGKWTTYKQYLKVEVGFNYIARIIDQFCDQVKQWREFEKNNKAEYVEYQRLKAKFET